MMGTRRPRGRESPELSASRYSIFCQPAERERKRWREGERGGVRENQGGLKWESKSKMQEEALTGKEEGF